jgi:micrococcal nuclease
MHACMIAILILAGPARAAPDFTALGRGERAEVAAAVDPLTLALKGGGFVRLAGLHMPDYDAAEPGPHALAALGWLREHVAGQGVVLYGQAQNRMGHRVAHVVLPDGTWVQGALLSGGWAQVRTTHDDARLAADMLAAEGGRDGNIWDRYPVLTPETIKENDLSDFRVVEGVVHGAALRTNVLYVNFGPDWRTDFTIAIPDAAARRRFAKAGLDPQNWAGRRVRARGWLRDYNGPYMEVDHPQAIEIIESPAAPRPPAL